MMLRLLSSATSGAIAAWIHGMRFTGVIWGSKSVGGFVRKYSSSGSLRCQRSSVSITPHRVPETIIAFSWGKEPFGFGGGLRQIAPAPPPGGGGHEAGGGV